MENVGGGDLQVNAVALAEAVAEAASASLPLGAQGTTAQRIGGKGWIEIKRFGKNRQRAYRYVRWREGKVKHSQYDGKAI